MHCRCSYSVHKTRVNNDTTASDKAGTAPAPCRRIRRVPLKRTGAPHSLNKQPSLTARPDAARALRERRLDRSRQSLRMREVSAWPASRVQKHSVPWPPSSWPTSQQAGHAGHPQGERGRRLPVHGTAQDVMVLSSAFPTHVRLRCRREAWGYPADVNDTFQGLERCCFLPSYHGADLYRSTPKQRAFDSVTRTCQI